MGHVTHPPPTRQRSLGINLVCGAILVRFRQLTPDFLSLFWEENSLAQLGAELLLEGEEICWQLSTDLCLLLPVSCPQAQGTMGQGAGKHFRAAAWGLLLGDTGSRSPGCHANCNSISNSGST